MSEGALDARGRGSSKSLEERSFFFVLVVFDSFPPLFFLFPSFALSLRLLSPFSPPPLLTSFAKVVPTILDASVVGGRASREADAKIRAAEGGSFPPASSSPAPSDAAFPVHAVHTYQYSITEKFLPLNPKSPAIPTVSISYDMSSLTLSLSRPKTPLARALVRLVAVGGGVKALASFFGALVHAVAGRGRKRRSGVGSSGSGEGE